jgi:hypothetical protein
MDRFRLVGAGEQRGWDCYDERLRGLQVDHQLAYISRGRSAGFSPIVHLNDSETVLPIGNWLLAERTSRPDEAMPK